jgi:hypothetical protein
VQLEKDQCVEEHHNHMYPLFSKDLNLMALCQNNPQVVALEETQLILQVLQNLFGEVSFKTISKIKFQTLLPPNLKE